MVAKPQISFEPQKKQKNELKVFCSFCGLEKIETSLKTLFFL